MKWKHIERMQAQKPKKKGWIVKPQYIEDVLLLDIYTDKILESRYCIDIKTGEHGYQKVGENWKKGKLITCLAEIRWKGTDIITAPMDLILRI